MARTPRRKNRQICVTVEQDGVWIYANPDGLKAIADYASKLAASKPSEHHELHLRWHLGSHGRTPEKVFVLMDESARGVHRRHRFEVTLMAVETKDIREFRRHERSGRLPKGWREE